MSHTPFSQTGHFGKDDYVPFFGQIEDVNDPKRSGRVRVRIIGWHPSEKQDDQEGVKTDSLPWSHVELPTTSSSQNRTGAKHRLQEGDYVRGYYLDGRDGQHPVVCASINFTAHVASKNLRKKVQKSDGRIPEDVEPFKIIDIQKPNNGLNSQKELEGGGDDEEDKSHHAIKDDSNDGNCPQQPNAFTTLKVEPFDITNPSSQVYDNDVVDALCGGVESARNKVNKIIKEFIPPNAMRFVGNGDDVFNILTGNKINLNGIFKKAAEMIAAELKDTIQVKKAEVQKNINNAEFRIQLFSTSSRSPLIGQNIDFALSVRFDLFNSIVDQSLLELITQVFNSLVSINNQQQTGQGDNLTSDIIVRPDTEIEDFGSICVTDQLIHSVELFIDGVISQAELETSIEYEKNADEVLELLNIIQTTVPEDFESDEDASESISASVPNNGGDSGLSLLLSTGNKILDMVLQLDFTLDPHTLNKSGVLSLNPFSLGGCELSTEYNTLTGLVGSMAGVSLDFGSGGGSSSGKSSKRKKDLNENIGFGGLPLDTILDSLVICEDAKTKKVKQKKKKDNDDPNVEIIPDGDNGFSTTISVPSSDEQSAKNFEDGIPNGILITNPGSGYYFDSFIPGDNFPSIYIDGYNGTPVPVVDKDSGEIVSILTNPVLFGNSPTPGVSVIPDSSSIGITTDDERYDTYICDFYVQNTGKLYSKDATIRIIDKDTNEENGEGRLVIKQGRIIDVEILNTGSGFKRLPTIIISDDNGFGAKIYPILCLRNTTGIIDEIEQTVHISMCPSRNRVNYAS